MAKKQQTFQNQKTNKSTKLKQNIAKLSPVQKIVTLTCIILVGLFAWNQVQIYQERAMYQRAEKQITQFIHETAKLASSKTRATNYCSYTSEKFSKGGLGCSVGSRVILYLPPGATREAIITEAKVFEDGIPWKIEEIVDNKQKMLRGVYYTVSTMKCSLRYMAGNLNSGSANDETDLNQAEKLLIELGCSGPALKEYY